MLMLAAPCIGQEQPDAHGTAALAEAEFQNGIAQANAGHLDQAEAAFAQGSRLSPKDPRFLVELGGISFKQKNYRKSIKWLSRARRLAPGDTYVNDFLGTLYFIEGNQEAAVKYWNSAGKPVVEEIRLQPGLRLDPVVMDRSFAFSRGEILKVADYWTTESKLRALGTFPIFTLRTDALPDGRFDVSLNAQERNGFGATKWEAMLSTFGGLFYETVTPEYYNLHGTATNLTSSWRWDAEKRRIAAGISGPLRRNPRWRYQLRIDLRNENWNVRNFSSLARTDVGFLNIRRSGGSAEITSIRSGRFTWSAGGEISHRDFRSVSSSALFTPELLIEGVELKQRASASYDLLRLPEKQYRLSVSGSSELGRIWGVGGGVSEKLESKIAQTWTLSSEPDGLQMISSARAGKTFGDPPFDEMFVLGIERDNDLQMRAHVGTQDGQKGNAPLGRHYFVANSELDRKLWGNGLIAVQIGPFVDVGKITDPLAYLGTKEWLWDMGGQVKLKVLGLRVGMTYGRDLRTGKGAFYTWVGK